MAAGVLTQAEVERAIAQLRPDGTGGASRRPDRAGASLDRRPAALTRALPRG
jgi:hypothetical protein